MTMRIATINELMAQMEVMFPLTFPDAKRLAGWEPQYRATLSGLDGDQLNAAWHAVMDIHKKATAPAPADFLKAHEALKAKRAAGPSSGSGSLDDRLKKRDEALRELRNKLAAEFWESHPKLRAASIEQKWLGLAEDQIKTGANMLAQRNMIRDDKRNAPRLDKEDQDYFGIYEIEGVEQLCITNAMIDRWKEWLSTPAPSKPGGWTGFERPAPRRDQIAGAA